MFGCVVQDRVGLVGLYADALVAARVSIYRGAAEDLVCFEVLLIQGVGTAEAIDER